MSRREGIYVKGFSHANPVPAACRLGNVLVSGLVTGLDSATGKMADGFEAQLANMLNGVREILHAAGGSLDDVIKWTIWLNDRSLREEINVDWLRMFPDEHTRPVRVTLNRDLGGGKLIECEFMAVLGDKN